MATKIALIQVDPVTLLSHTGAKHAGTHLAKDEPELLRQIPQQPGSVMEPEKGMAILEMLRDFWLALANAHQQDNLPDEIQKDIAQLLNNVGKLYVKPEVMSQHQMQSMVDVENFDAEGHRFLIQKLKAEPIIKADRIKMAMVERLGELFEAKKPPSQDELVNMYNTLGQNVKLTPLMLRAILEHLLGVMKKNETFDLAKAEQMANQGNFTCTEALKVVGRVQSTPGVEKPEKANALLDLFTNFWMAMHQTKQDQALRVHYQRLVAETLKNAAALYAPPVSPPPPPVDRPAFRRALAKLKTEPAIKADKEKAAAVEQLAQAEATFKPLSKDQLLEIMKVLGKAVILSPDILKIILEYMCVAMKKMTVDEKNEMQKRMTRATTVSPTDLVQSHAKIKDELEATKGEAKLVGFFQVFPQGHKGIGGYVPAPTRAQEVGMRAGPASVDWHRYTPLGVQPAAVEMAKIMLVQTQIANRENFSSDDRTQKTLQKVSEEISFRSIVQPSVIAKYEQSFKGNKEALGALKSLYKAQSASDVSKETDKLLTTVDIDKKQLNVVLQQMTRDNLMTAAEARELQLLVDTKLGPTGTIKLSDMKELLVQIKKNKK